MEKLDRVAKMKNFWKILIPLLITYISTVARINI